MSGRDGLLAAALRIALPVIMAFAAGALILVALGKNPLEYYQFVFQRGLFSWAGLQETITRSAPLLLIAAGLIVAFRAGLGSRRRWPIPTGRGRLFGAGAMVDRLPAALVDADHIACCSRSGRRELVIDPGAPESALRSERNHHHLDDVVPWHLLRQCADQAGFCRSRHYGSANTDIAGAIPPAAAFRTPPSISAL